MLVETSDKEFRMMTEETSRTELMQDLRAAGLEGRRDMMIHASYKVLAPVEGGPEGVSHAFGSIASPGRLLYPTFDFTSWSELGYWDRERSPSKMGVITELERARCSSLRTAHPMVSFVLCGSGYVTTQGGYYADTPNAHGVGSVFDTFIKNDGVLVSIGADQQTGFKPDDVGFTATIHALVEAGVEWRTMKCFTGTYIDYDGKTSIRTYSASVNRWPEKYQTAVTPGHLAAEKAGVIRLAKLGRTVMWVANAREFHSFVMENAGRAEWWRREI